MPRFTPTEIDAMLAQAKIVSDLTWVNSPTNSAFLRASAVVFDDSDATIPGLTVQLDYRIGAIVEECNYKFGLFKWRDGGPRRVYQIEVCHKTKRSHAGDTDLYGPHQHFADDAKPFEPELPWGCNDHEAWFNEFLRRANIGFGGRYLYPIADDLI